MSTDLTEALEDQITEVMIQGNELQLLREKAEIDIQVSTAKAFPRNTELALKNMLFTATMDMETAEKCTYAVPRGGKSITGKSVTLARICVQSWGNMRAESKVVNITDKYVESEAIAWDLEANVAVKVSVKRSILQNDYDDQGRKTGRMIRMNDDMITVTGNAANSISFRNAVFNVVPNAITDKVYSHVQAKIIGDMENYQRRLKKVVAGFKEAYDKSEKEVLALVGKTDLKQIKPADLVVLIGVATSLKDGDSQLDNIFKPVAKTAEEKKADLKEKQADKPKEEANYYASESAALDAELAKGEQGKINLP